VAALVAAGFFAGVAPHLVLSTGAVGGPASAGMLGNGPDIYAGIVYSNAGWKSDRVALANPPPDALLAVLGKDTQRLPTNANYRAAFIRTWLYHPLESIAVSLHKLYVAWRYPYNDSRATLLFGRTGVTVFHQVMLCLALLGYAGERAPQLPLALPVPVCAAPGGEAAGAGNVTRVEERFCVSFNASPSIRAATSRRRSSAMSRARW